MSTNSSDVAELLQTGGPFQQMTPASHWNISVNLHCFDPIPAATFKRVFVEGLGDCGTHSLIRFIMPDISPAALAACSVCLRQLLPSQFGGMNVPTTNLSDDAVVPI